MKSASLYMTQSASQEVRKHLASQGLILKKSTMEGSIDQQSFSLKSGFQVKRINKTNSSASYQSEDLGKEVILLSLIFPSVKGAGSWGGVKGTGQLVKGLPCKSEDLSSLHRTHTKASRNGGICLSS